MRHLIKTSGEIVHIGKSTMSEIKALIGADTLDSFSLADRVHVCILDDAGHKKGLPYNHEATRRYLARCRPGTTHTIVGDVVIVPNADFGDPRDFGFSPTLDEGGTDPALAPIPRRRRDIEEMQT